MADPQIDGPKSGESHENLDDDWGHPYDSGNLYVGIFSRTFGSHLHAFYLTILKN